MVEVDEVVTSSEKLQEYIDSYNRPFVIKLKDDPGVDIVSQFRELDSVDVDYRDFRTWEIRPSPDNDSEISDTQKSADNIGLTDSNLRFTPRQIRLLFGILIGVILVSWAILLWESYPRWIEQNTPLLTLLSLIVGGLSLMSTRYII